MVRIDNESGHIFKVPPSQLQNKSGRDYFQQGIRLNDHEVYFSRFDLNVEHQANCCSLSTDVALCCAGPIVMVMKDKPVVLLS